MPGDISSLESGFVFNIINLVSKLFGINSSITEYFVRKMAHFTEYAILGILLISTKLSYLPYITTDIFIVLFFGLLVPVTDETIQLFIEGRSGQVTDILIDFSGVISGIIVSIILYKMLKSKKFKS